MKYSMLLLVLLCAPAYAGSPPWYAGDWEPGYVRLLDAKQYSCAKPATLSAQEKAVAAHEAAAWGCVKACIREWDADAPREVKLRRPHPYLYVRDAERCGFSVSGGNGCVYANSCEQRCDQGDASRTEETLVEATRLYCLAEKECGRTPAGCPGARAYVDVCAKPRAEVWRAKRTYEEAEADFAASVAGCRGECANPACERACEWRDTPARSAWLSADAALGEALRRLSAVSGKCWLPPSGSEPGR